VVILSAITRKPGVKNLLVGERTVRVVCQAINIAITGEGKDD
jgi:hypothetical protein